MNEMECGPESGDGAPVALAPTNSLAVGVNDG